MAGHPPFPHPEEPERFMQHPVPIIKQRVAESPTQKHPPEGRRRDEVAHLFLRQIRIAVPGKPAQHLVAENEPEHIGGSIPADAKAVAELHDERAEVVDVVSEHENLLWQKIRRLPTLSLWKKPPRRPSSPRSAEYRSCIYLPPQEN